MNNLLTKDYQGITYYIADYSADTSADKPVFLWAHGWGHNHGNMMDLAAPFHGNAMHIMVDFPGFGQSAAPAAPWGTRDYADQIAALIRENTDQPVIWVGHSFGCRVGLQMAAHYPDLVKGLFLVGGAGIPKQLPFYKSLYFKARIYTYKGLKKLVPFGLSQKWLIGKFGSADYQNADPVMRQILVKVVNEDLRDRAANIQCPVQFVYGANDQEAPPSIGEAFCRVINNSKIVVLKGQDHYSVLSNGRHPVIQLLKSFIQTLGSGSVQGQNPIK